MDRDLERQEVEVHIGKDQNGRWIAATCSSPFFFLEAETQSDVHDLAVEAVRFYSENRHKLPAESTFSRGQAEQHFDLTDVTRELLYA